LVDAVTTSSVVHGGSACSASSDTSAMLSCSSSIFSAAVSSEMDSIADGNAVSMSLTGSWGRAGVVGSTELAVENVDSERRLGDEGSENGDKTPSSLTNSLLDLRSTSEAISSGSDIGAGGDSSEEAVMVSPVSKRAFLLAASRRLWFFFLEARCLLSKERGADGGADCEREVRDKRWEERVRERVREGRSEEEKKRKLMLVGFFEKEKRHRNKITCNHEVRLSDVQ